MNIILLEPEEVVNDTTLLHGDRAKHIVKVLRSSPGDTVKVGVVNGKSGYGVIKLISARQPYSVSLDISLVTEPSTRRPIDILLALPRPIMLRRILSQVATLGIGHLFVVNANRVEKSFWNASLIDSASCRTFFLDGLGQAGDTRLPEVSFHRGFRPFIEGDFLNIRADYTQLLLAHPDCNATLTEVFQSGNGRRLLAIGPEGGWVEYELARMLEAGFNMFSLGDRILKVDTAVTALHSMISLLINK